jgi:hypothetical protein
MYLYGQLEGGCSYWCSSLLVNGAHARLTVSEHQSGPTSYPWKAALRWHFQMSVPGRSLESTRTPQNGVLNCNQRKVSIGMTMMPTPNGLTGLQVLDSTWLPFAAPLRIVVGAHRTSCVP